MDDLTHHFPNCTLKTEEIREAIQAITGMSDSGIDIYYFCYKCFKYLGMNNPSALCCKICYRFYCSSCSIPLSVDRTGRVIDPRKCIQCMDNIMNLQYTL